MASGRHRRWHATRHDEEAPYDPVEEVSWATLDVEEVLAMVSSSKAHQSTTTGKGSHYMFVKMSEKK